MGLWKRRRRRRRGEEEIEGVGDGGKRRHRGEEEGGGGDGGSWRNCPLLDSERRKLSVSFFLFPLSFFLNFICFLRLIKKYWACNQKKCLAEPGHMPLLAACRTATVREWFSFDLIQGQSSIITTRS